MLTSFLFLEKYIVWFFYFIMYLTKFIYIFIIDDIFIDAIIKNLYALLKKSM